MPAKDCPICGRPRTGERYCSVKCGGVARTIRNLERTNERLRRLVEDLQASGRTPLTAKGELHCLTCGRASSARWCSVEHREEYLEALEKGRRWPLDTTYAILRHEEREHE